MGDATSAIDVGRLLQTAQEALQISLPHRDKDLHLDGLARLVAAFERSIDRSPAILRLAKREIYVWLLSHVGFERDLVAYPEITDVPVAQPLFVIGFGRSGSSLLQNLLALPREARAPRLWELWNPSPPSRPNTADSEPRIEAARQRLEFLAKAAPVVALAHPMDPEAPDECQWMMRHSTLWVMLYDVPDYWAWLKSLSVEELRPLFAYYRLQVQHLMLFKRGYWMSKAFSHLHFLPVLYDVFPDARMVRLHRDPTAAIPSLCSLARSYRSIFSTRVDARAIGAGMLDLFLDGMARSMALDRARPEAPVVDVHFADLVADPIGTARRVLGQLNYPCDAGAERAMQAYLEKAAAAPAYQHRYSLEEFGLDRAEVLDRSAEYLAWAEARCGRSLVG
jgi:hypothetical protein